MIEAGTCAKCGSTEVIPDARVLYDSDRDVKIRVDADPEALIFTERVRSNLHARVCSQCGYTEFYVREAANLYDAYLKSKNKAHSD